MKRTLFVLTAAVMVTLFSAEARAQPRTFETPTSDWRYVWHEGHWWYWTPQNSWLVWSESGWTAYAQPNCPTVASMTQPMPYSTSYGNDQVPGAAQAPQPAYWGGSYQPAYSSGSGANYSGYGWTWGPGTAFRDSPGRRF